MSLVEFLKASLDKQNIKLYVSGKFNNKFEKILCHKPII